MAASALNTAQRAAVEHDAGPVLVLAGAGSGKTRVVTERIARLLERGVHASNILAMTFTNKAAAEMHERVTRLVGGKAAKELTVCTFHRFGLTVLARETRAVGVRGQRFALFDQADAASLVREILREIRVGRTYDVSAIVARISAAKNAFVDPETWERVEREGGEAIDEYDEIASLVYPRYIAAQRSQQAFDFDDLICEVVRLWRRRSDVLDSWRARYRYVIVDEYQDTNHAQLQLVLLLGGEHRNVCVVGDDDQSIYAWRGADVRNILDFERHFPGAKVVKLQDNYRSRRAIVDVANAVLAKASGRRHGKTCVATREGSEKVQVVVAADPEIEASFIATETQRLLEGGLPGEVRPVRPRDIAVLYRSNLQSAEIESALKERQIPYRMIGGTQLYERKEVKDLVAYLRVAIDPRDELSLRRIINYPARGVGDAAVARLSSQATADGATLWSVVSRSHAVSGLAPAAVEGCRALVRVVEATRQRFEAAMPSAEVARALVADVGMTGDIHAGSANPKAAARRLGNLDSTIAMFARRDARGLGDRAKLAELLRVLALREEGEDEDGGDRVTLTTMHAAKGLEFAVVFVAGLEEGLLPHARCLQTRATDVALPAGDDGALGGNGLDEERRLFYVAVTRARDRLYLSRAQVRGARGKRVQRTPSRFLCEIPPELIDQREASSPVAPGLEQTRTGAQSVLATLGALAGGLACDGPFIPRPRG